MKRPLWFVVVPLVVVLVVAACGGGDTTVGTGDGADDGSTDSPTDGSSDDGNGDSPTDGSSDDGADDSGDGGDVSGDGGDVSVAVATLLGDSEWLLTHGTVDGDDLVLIDTHPVTIGVRQNTIGGTAACNSYFADPGMDGFLFGGIGSTEMACFPPETMDLEFAYLTALARTTHAATDGDDVVLTGDGVTLRFSAIAPTPDAPLTDTEWLLDTLVDGQAASSTVGGYGGSIVFAPNEVSGSDGCNSFSGSYEIDGDTIRFGSLAQTLRGCPEDVGRQSDHVHAVIGSDPAFAIEGDRLTLTGDDGRALIYRAG